MNQNITIPTDLLVAINHLCTYVESKILLATMCCDYDAQIRKMAGITQPNNYFRARKQLLNLDHIMIDANGIHINADKILNDYKEEFEC